MELAEKLTNITFLFYCSKKCKFMFVSVSASFILLQIGENWHTKCQGHKKRCHHLSRLRLGSTPAPPTLPVFRVVLPHTEASGQGLFRCSHAVVVRKFSAALVVLRRTALVDSKQTDDAGLNATKHNFCCSKLFRKL